MEMVKIVMAETEKWFPHRSMPNATRGNCENVAVVTIDGLDEDPGF